MSPVTADQWDEKRGETLSDGLDVVILAAALDNVDRDYERGWTPAHYARAIASEYDRLLKEGGA